MKEGTRCLVNVVPGKAQKKEKGHTGTPSMAVVDDGGKEKRK